MVTAIDAAWTTAELQLTFLGKWRDQLNTLATDYNQMMDRHVKDGANHVCFSESRDHLYDAFEFLYLNLYTYMGNTGDLNIAQKFSELNDLISWYTTTAKAHKTRMKNKGLQQEMPEDNVIDFPEVPTESEEPEVPTVDVAEGTTTLSETTEVVESEAI